MAGFYRPSTASRGTISNRHYLGTGALGVCYNSGDNMWNYMWNYSRFVAKAGFTVNWGEEGRGERVANLVLRTE